MMQLLENKTCIISGASRGIGQAIAKLFYNNGANVALCSRSLDGLGDGFEDLFGDTSRVFCSSIDVSQKDQCQVFVEAVKEKFGGIDVLINCAGIITREPTLELSQEIWQKVLDTNLNGTFYMSQLVLQDMQKKKTGSIVNIASQMAHMPHPGAAPSYECSKAAIIALTRHLALEFGQDNVRVNAISPGSIETGLQKDMPQDVWQEIKKNIPLGRLGHVDEAAQTALFLASDMSSYTTGSVLYVTGGSLMN